MLNNSCYFSVDSNGGGLMRYISTTIKKVWLEQILSGEKVIEFKGATDFWIKRLMPMLEGSDRIIINFLCGRKSFKFTVLNVCHVRSRRPFKIDEVYFYEWFEIHIGGVIYGE